MSLSLTERLLEAQDEIATRTTRRVVAEWEEHERSLPAPSAWPPIPLPQLEAAVRELVRRGLVAISRDEPPAQGDLDVVEQLAAARARQGEPVDRMLESFRAAGRELLAAVEAETVSQSVPAAEALRVSNQIWDWLDRLMASVARAHHGVQVAMARHDQEARLAFLRQVVSGGLTASRLATGASFGLAPDRPHHAVRARPGPEHPLDEVERELRTNGRGAGVVGVLDGDLVGIVPTAPAGELPLAVGVGPPATLAAMPVSFAMASRALETALASGRTGFVTIEELSLLPAVLAEKELGDAIFARRVEPLLGHGDFGLQVLASVRAYLEADQRIDAAAAALYVHPNTLRHRLQRYERLTGTTLRRPQDLVEVWWALKRQELSDSADTAPRALSDSHPPRARNPGVAGAVDRARPHGVAPAPRDNTRA